MEIHAVLHPIARPLARDDVLNAGHREDAFRHRPTFRLRVVFNSIRRKHDVEVKGTIRKLNKISAGDDVVFNRVINRESELADCGDEAAAIVGILGRKHIDVLCRAWKAEENGGPFPDEQIIDACGRERLGHFLCLQRIERRAIVHYSGAG